MRSSSAFAGGVEVDALDGLASLVSASGSGSDSSADPTPVVLTSLDSTIGALAASSLEDSASVVDSSTATVSVEVAVGAAAGAAVSAGSSHGSPSV